MLLSSVKMMKSPFILLIFCLVGLKTVFGEKVRKCNNCILATNCDAFGDMKEEEQIQWKRKNTCEKPKDDEAEEINTMFGFAPLARDGYVCCPIESKETNEEKDGKELSSEENNETNTTKTESRFGWRRPGHRWNQNDRRNQNNYQPGFGNMIHFPRNENQGIQENNRGSRFRPIYQRPNGRNNFGNTHQEITDRGSKTNPGFGTNNPGGGSFLVNSQQCEDLIKYPPTLDSGCCGIDGTESNRISGTTKPRNSSPWAPRMNDDYNEGSSYPGWFPTFFSSKVKSRKTRSKDEKPVVSVDNRIAGGKATAVGEFPWLVLLTTVFVYGNKEEAFNCGGSVISSSYILTAGHCVSETGARVKDVEITLAEYDKQSYPQDCVNGEDGLECITNIKLHSSDVIPHPQYDERILQNDIALIRVHSRIPYTNFIRPICLPPIDIDSPEFKDLPLSIAGWGRNGVYTSNVKQSTVVNLVPQAECKKAYSFLNRRHVCAAGYSGEDTCKGDSGGPLMVLFEGKYFVSGVVSGKRADSPCGTSVPSLYTNVYHYLDWIKSNLRY